MILAIDCVFSAATAPAVYELGWRCFGREGQDRQGGLRVALCERVAVGAVSGGDAVCGEVGVGYDAVDVFVCVGGGACAADAGGWGRESGGRLALRRGGSGSRLACSGE